MPKEVDLQQKRSEFADATWRVMTDEGLPAATMRRIAAETNCTTVGDYESSGSCQITLFDPASGQSIDAKTATQGSGGDTVQLDMSGRPRAYLSDLTCNVRVTAAP